MVYFYSILFVLSVLKAPDLLWSSIWILSRRSTRESFLLLTLFLQWRPASISKNQSDSLAWQAPSITDWVAMCSSYRASASASVEMRPRPAVPGSSWNVKWLTLPAGRNLGVVVNGNPWPCVVPRIVAEYLNRIVQEENVNSKSVEEITSLVQKHHFGCDLHPQVLPHG